MYYTVIKAPSLILFCDNIQLRTNVVFYWICIDYGLEPRNIQISVTLSFFPQAVSGPNVPSNMSANRKLQKVRASRDRLVLRCSGSLFLLRISVRQADSTHRCIPEPFLMSYKCIRLCQIALHWETWKTDGQSRSGLMLWFIMWITAVWGPPQHPMSAVWQPFWLNAIFIKDKCIFYWMLV